MKRKFTLLKILLVLLLVFAGLVWYLNSFFLPVTVKRMLVANLEQSLGRAVEMEKVFYRPLQGVSVTGLAVYDGKEKTGKKTLRIEEIRLFGLGLPSFTKERRLKAVFTASVRNLYLSLPPQEISGDLRLYLSLVKAGKEIRYRGKAVLEGMTVRGIPVAGEIREIRGIVSFSPDLVTAEEITGIVRKIPFSAAGKIRNFSRPEIEGRLNTIIDLAAVPPEMLPDPVRKQLEKLQPAGQAKITVDVNGPLDNNGKPKFVFAADLNRVAFTCPFLGRRVENVTGKINLQETGVLAAALDSTDLTLKLDSKLDTNNLKISDFSGRLGKSTYDLAGTISWSGTPVFDIYGNLKLDAASLVGFLPGADKVSAAGEAAVSLFGKGNPSAPRGIDAGFKMNSAFLKIAGIEFTDIVLDGRLQNAVFQLREGRANLYGGKLGAEAQIHPFDPEAVNPIKIQADQVPVEKLAPGAGGGKKTAKVSGNLSASGGFSGKGFVPKNYSGQGWFSISGGTFQEIPALTSVSNLLKLEDKSGFVFKTAKATFTLEDGNVYTDDLVLTDSYVNLKGAGKVNFAGQLDFTLDLEFTPEFYQTSPPEFQAIAAVTQLGKYATGVKLTGTVKNPKTELATRKPEKIIRDLFENILKGISK